MGTRRVKDWLALHPGLDPVLMCASGLATLFAAWIWCPSWVAAHAVAGFQAQSAFAGLTLAASTFACGLIYSSTSEAVMLIRDRFAAPLRLNWGWILCVTFASGILPIFSIFLVETARPFALAFSASSLAGLLAASARSVFWTQVVLLAEHTGWRNSWVDEPPYAETRR